MTNNILIVSDCPTHPTTAGNRNGILSCCRLLEKEGLCVKFLYITNPLDNDIQEMKEYWKDHLYIYKTSIIQFLIQRLLFILARKITKNFLYINMFCPWGVSTKENHLIKQYDIN